MIFLKQNSQKAVVSKQIDTSKVIMFQLKLS